MAWWQKINPQSLRGHRRVGAARGAQMQRFAAQGRMAAEPMAAAAVARSSMPAHMARRISAEFGADVSRQQRDNMRSMGLGDDQVGPRDRRAADYAEAARDQARQQREPESESMIWSAIKNGIDAATGGPIRWGLSQIPGLGFMDDGDASDLLEAAPSVASKLPSPVKAAGTAIKDGVATGLEVAGNFVAMPMAAGAASGPIGEFEAGMDEAAAGFAQRKPGSVGDVGHNAMMSVSPAGAAVGAFSDLFDWVKGAFILSGAPLMSEQQKDDMRKAGETSAWDYYYDDFFGGGLRAVDDAQIRELENEYGRDNIANLRELAIATADTDGTLDPSGMTDGAQAAYARITSGQADEDELTAFRKVSDRVSLTFGGFIAEGLPLGSTERQVTGALGNLAATWYVDPFAAAGSIVKVSRFGLRGIAANSIEESRLAIAASDDLHRPTTAIGRTIDNTLDTVDRIELNRRAGNWTEVARLTDEHRRLHPDMNELFDAMMVTRRGTSDGMRIREGDEIATEARDAAEAGRRFDPTVMSGKADDVSVPRWSLRDDLDEVPTDEARAQARADLADQIGLIVWREAITSGRPMYRGQMLLPGEVAINRRVRQQMVNVANWASDKTGRLMSKLDNQVDDPKNLIKLDGTMSAAVNGIADIINSADVKQWTRNEYAQGIPAMFARAASKFNMSFSGRAITFNTAEGTESFRRFAVQFLPRDHANALTAEWAGRNPAGRIALWRETVTSITDAAGLRNSPQAQVLVESLTKGTVRKDSSLGPARNEMEIYGTPANNVVAVGDTDVAAGIFPFQITDQVQLPSLRDIRQASDHRNALAIFTRLSHSHLMNTFMSVWKTGKVGTPANMGRQAIEAVALSAVDSGAGALKDWAINRRRVALAAADNRQLSNELDRLSLAVYKEVKSVEDLVDLDALRADAKLGAGKNLTIDPASAYRSAIERLAIDAGYKGDMGRVLALINEDVDVMGIAENLGWRKAWLPIAAPLDAVRRARVALAERVNAKSPELAGQYGKAEFQQYVDDELIAQMGQHVNDEIANQVADYTGLISQANVAHDMTDMARTGLRAERVHIPNTWQHETTLGSPGAMRWAVAVDRLQRDPIAAELARWIAHDTVHGKGSYPAKRAVEIAEDDETLLALRAEADERSNPDLTPDRQIELNGEIAARLEVALANEFAGGAADVEEYARWLINNTPAGERMKQSAIRLHVNEDGSPTQGVGDRDAAISRLARVQVEEVRHHLGDVARSDAYRPIHAAIADGRPVTAKMLSEVPDAARPSEVAEHLYLPAMPGWRNRIAPSKIRQSIANGAAKYYDLTVARPLARIAHHPIFMAQKNAAVRDMEPVFNELVAKGVSYQAAGVFLEATANKRALETMFRYTDNPNEHTAFSEMAENFLVFQRSMEDFVRRFARVASANPANVARAWLMTEASVHSGVVTIEPTSTDGGATEHRMMVTYPGSGLMAQALAEAGQALGWGSSDLVTTPYFADFKAPVRYFNASLSNPVGISANPMIGMPLRAVRAYWPGAIPETNAMIAAIEGGEQFFAEQSIADSLAPTLPKRLFDGFIDRDVATSQLASATRQAMIYMEAAGNLPSPEASEEEVQDAHDAVRQMAQNIVMLRAVGGAFLPGSPLVGDSDIDGMPEPNIIDMQRGISNVQNEWFEVLEAASQRHGPDRGFAEANIEWARRYPKGSSILNPQAFVVGRTNFEDVQKSGASNLELTEWMLDNASWLKDHSSVAFRLLPALGIDYFDRVGYRAQLTAGVRENKSTTEFYADLRQAVGVREWWEAKNAHDRRLTMATSEADRDAAYAIWNEWQDNFEMTNPVVMSNKRVQETPEYVINTLIPGLRQVVESDDMPEYYERLRPQLAEMLDSATAFQDAYVRIDPYSRDGVWDRRELATDWRRANSAKWSGTELEDLWRTMQRLSFRED